jgi:hypothetical protein
MTIYRFNHPYMTDTLSVAADSALGAIGSVVDAYRNPEQGKDYANKLKYIYACDPDGLTALDGDADVGEACADDQAARFVALYGIGCAMAVATADRPEGRSLQAHLVARIYDMALDCQSLDEAGRAILEATNDEPLDESLEEFFDYARYAKAQNELGNVTLHLTKEGTYLVFLR